MAAPVISPITSILAYRMGEYWVYQPAATGTPTSWSATGLPEGMSIHATTGKISGAATEPGVFDVNLHATNGDGTGSLIFPMAIEAASLSLGAAIDLDMDLGSGEVSNPEMKGQWKSEDGLPVVLFGKLNDRLLIAAGFQKTGVLQPLALARVDLAIKEYEPEPLLVITDGTMQTLGSWDTTRFQFVLHLDPAKLQSVLSNYEDDRDTHVDVVAELRYRLLHILPGDEAPTELERSSQNFVMRIARDLAPEPDDEGA